MPPTYIEPTLVPAVLQDEARRSDYEKKEHFQPHNAGTVLAHGAAAREQEAEGEGAAREKGASQVLVEEAETRAHGAGAKDTPRRIRGR